MIEPATASFADIFPAPKPELQPTAEQFSIITCTQSPLKVMSFAGTGKTTTLQMRAARYFNKRMLYATYNKAAESAVRGKFPDHVTVKTVHAFAYGHTGRRYRNNLGKLSAYQVSRFLNCSYYGALLIIRTIENWCNSADPRLAPDHVAEDFLRRFKGVGVDGLLDAAGQVWAEIVAGTNPALPMTHSGYLKLFQLQQPSFGFPVLLLDEAQDSNPVTQDLIMSQAQYGSEIILVGDGYQGIYGWRGASNALQKIPAHTLFLTHSFRFGPRLAEVANLILKTYFAEKRNIVGTGDTQVRPVDTTGRYTIIARTNAFVFQKAWALCGDHRLYIPGTTSTGDLPIFNTLLDLYHLYFGEKHLLKDPEIKCFESFAEVQELAETECLDPEYQIGVRIVLEHTANIPTCIEGIKSALVFNPQDADVILTTAHRSKGLEWENVLLAEDFPKLFDNDGKLKPLGEEEQQIHPEEIHLQYVAITRAKKVLQLNPELWRLVATQKAQSQTGN